MFYFRRLNDYIDVAKDYYYFNEYGHLFTEREGKLLSLKAKNSGTKSGSYRFMTTESKISSVSIGTLKKYFNMFYSQNKNQYYLFEVAEDLNEKINDKKELVEIKEINKDKLKQLSAFDDRAKDYYYFNDEGKLFSGRGNFKALKIKNDGRYALMSIDNKIISISPNQLKELYFGNSFKPIAKEGEIFKDVEGYEGIYTISNYGRLFNTKKELKPYLLNNGYYSCILCKDGNRKNKTIHQLVAKHFVEGYKEGLVVNHKDLNKTNNHYSNLEWITPKENSIHYHQNKNKLAI